MKKTLVILFGLFYLACAKEVNETPSIEKSLLKHSKGEMSLKELVSKHSFEEVANYYELTELEKDRLYSSNLGIIYEEDPNPLYGNRIYHIVDHMSKSIRKKPIHSIFSISPDELITLIDDVYSCGSDYGTVNRGNYVIECDLQKTIGKDGEEIVRVILEDDKKTIITAYPVKSFKYRRKEQ